MLGRLAPLKDAVALILPHLRHQAIEKSRRQAFATAPVTL
jgi:hypothetical protein